MEKKTKKEEAVMSEAKYSPLRNEKIFVRFVPRDVGTPLDPKHPCFGGKADGTWDRLVVPTVGPKGNYKNVLTNAEKDYLEEILDLDSNALSVYKQENNFWDDYKVELTKDGLHLDLSNPEDYIKYKVLLANNDIVAPSVQERIDRPKQTYRYEIVRASEETGIQNAKLNATMASYKEFGKIDNDIDTMRVLVELLDSRPYDRKSPAEFFRGRINALIQANPKAFLQQITDPLLHTKVIIRRATELGKITKRTDYYYLASDGSPLCEAGENSTLSVAARFLSDKAHQDIMFMLESEVDKNRV